MPEPKYFEEASSIDFQAPQCVKYVGSGVLGTALDLRLKRMKLKRPPIFEDRPGEKLLDAPVPVPLVTSAL